MKKSRLTESQIVAILKEADAGMGVSDLCRHGRELPIGPVRMNDSYLRFAADFDPAKFTIFGYCGDGDGIVDLVVQVDSTALALTESSEVAVLEGQTFDGMDIRGTDTINIVP